METDVHLLKEINLTQDNWNLIVARPGKYLSNAWPNFNIQVCDKLFGLNPTTNTLQTFDVSSCIPVSA